MTKLRKLKYKCSEHGWESSIHECMICIEQKNCEHLKGGLGACPKCMKPYKDIERDDKKSRGEIKLSTGKKIHVYLTRPKKRKKRNDKTA